MQRRSRSVGVGQALVVVGLAATLPLTGCSFLFVQPPHESDDFRSAAGCTTSPVAPVIDTIFTLTNVGSALYVASEDNVTNKGTAVGAGLLVGALWLSSAIYGYYNTSQCAELQRNLDDGPYRGPVHTVRPSWGVRRVAPATIEPPPPPPPPAATTPAAEAAPDGAVPPPPAPSPAARPVVPQQMDDDDPGRRRPRSGTGAYPAPAQYPE